MFGQAANETSKGIVSYVSSQNVYVQFVNTDGIEPGDTLYSQTNDMYIPALIVKEKSTISCLCIDTNDYLPAVRNQVFAKLKSPVVPVEVAVQNSKQAVSVNDLAISGSKSKTSKDKSSSSIIFDMPAESAQVPAGSTSNNSPVDIYLLFDRQFESVFT